MVAKCRLFVNIEKPLLTLTVETIVVTAWPVMVESAALTAAIFTVDGDGAAEGAVYRPELEILPAVALPPVTPFTDQVTPVLEVPVTVAENCCVFPACTEADVGVTETEMAAPPVIVTGADAVLLESAALQQRWLR